MIQDFEEKESLLLRKIAGLELAKEQIEEGAVSDLEQLRIEVTCSFDLSFGWSLQKGFLMLYQSWASQTINCIRHDMVEDLGLSWFTLFIFGYLITLMWILFGRHGLFLTNLCIHSMVRICGEVGGMFFCLAAQAASKEKWGAQAAGKWTSIRREHAWDAPKWSRAFARGLCFIPWVPWDYSVMKLWDGLEINGQLLSYCCMGRYRK